MRIQQALNRELHIISLILFCIYTDYCGDQTTVARRATLVKYFSLIQPMPTIVHVHLLPVFTKQCMFENMEVEYRIGVNGTKS
jgi:hypothetical protein